MGQSIADLKGYFLFFVVIVAGVAGGIYLAGFFSAQKGDVEASPQNMTQFRVGDSFPEIVVTDSAGFETNLSSYTSGKKCIVGFISAGCTPCHWFAEFAEKLPEITTGEYSLILLLHAGQSYDATAYAHVFSLQDSVFARYHINTAPTILGLDERSTIKSVIAGFAPEFKEVFFEDMKN